MDENNEQDRDINNKISQNENVTFEERKRWTFFGLPFTFTIYTLTPKKLSGSNGFFTSNEDDILLYRVMDISLTRTLSQKMFGLGTVGVISSDKTMPNLEVKNIKNYKQFKDTLENYVENERLRMRFRTGEMLESRIDDMDDDDDDDYMI